MVADWVVGMLEVLDWREGLLHTMRHRSSVLSPSSIHVAWPCSKSCNQAVCYSRTTRHPYMSIPCNRAWRWVSIIPPMGDPFSSAIKYPFVKAARDNSS